MRRALIINGTGFTPCSQPCGSLTTLLRSAQLFDVVQETCLGSWTADNDVIPDLILPRLPLDDWASPRLEACKKAWTSVKTFALLCGRNAKQQIEIPPSLVEVDDFLVCPYQQNELIIRLLRLIKDTVPAVPAIQPRDSRQDLDPVIGDSQPFLQAMHRVNLFARSKAAVVISGETGSGKELLARAVHYQSARKSKPFIPVNCGALPDELFENELFGHLKGAYTNAAAAEKGLIAEAEGGTLFLDEVDTLSPAAQVKLLRFLQSGEYRPLGSSRATVADVRIVSATNTDLARLVELKIFREDLLFRLNVLSLTIPPLRERGVDVLKLAAHFLAVYARQHDRPLPGLSEKVLEEFLKYSWPGNVRELESMIQRAIVMQDSAVLTPRDFSLPTTNQPQPEAALFQKAKSLAIGHFESNFIAKLLALHDGNISRAAKAAGKDRRSFQRLVTKYALDRSSFKNQAS